MSVQQVKVTFCPISKWNCDSLELSFYLLTPQNQRFVMIFLVGLHKKHTEIVIAEANMCPKSNSNIKSYSYLQNNTQKKISDLKFQHNGDICQSPLKVSKQTLQ